MAEKPKAHTSLAEKELDKAEKQFDAFDQNIKELTHDRMNMSPKLEEEPQTKMSVREQQKAADIYLKPHKTIGCRDKFNEKFRDQYNFDKEYVKFIAENKEWLVPVNKPVWGPRYLAEQIRRKTYHRLVMQRNTVRDVDHMGTYDGQMVADSTIDRLTAMPVTDRKSIFMGSNGF